MMKIRLPNFLYPKYETELIRLGKKNDGGYSISSESLYNTEYLFSFGINDDFSFEEDFYNKAKAKTKVKIKAYDFVVSWKFFIRQFINGDIRSLIKYIKHKYFFKGNDKIHIKKYIVPIGSKNIFPYFAEDKITDINSILLNNQSDNLFFKIDIEGSEYRILNQLIENESRLSGLAIEFHDCDLHKDKIKNFIENFKLQLVHIHVNNADFIDPDGFPRALELTFSPPKFNKENLNNHKKFPTLIDQPNNLLSKDYIIEFYD